MTQIYGYIAHHSLKYGLLTNGQVFWFLFRPNLATDPGKLFISPPVSLENDNPTLFRSLFYFTSLVMQGHLSGKSPVNPNFPAPETMIHTAIPRHQLNTRSQKKFKKSLMHEDFPVDLDLADESILIGRGFCGNVFKSIKNGVELALKCCDINNNKDGFEMMQNEIEIYSKLKSLQGQGIPKLHWYGVTGDIFVIATSFIQGKRPEQLETEVIEHFSSILAQNGVEHGDLRTENVIVDDKNQFWLIDYGKSKQIENS